MRDHRHEVGLQLRKLRHLLAHLLRGVVPGHLVHHEGGRPGERLEPVDVRVGEVSAGLVGDNEDADGAPVDRHRNGGELGSVEILEQRLSVALRDRFVADQRVAGGEDALYNARVRQRKRVALGTNRAARYP